MTIVVTGGAGYIGSEVVKKLSNSFVIDRNEGSEIDEETLDRCLPNCKAVIHLAGTHYEFSPHDCYQDLANFILLTRMMRKHGITKLVLASSAAVYGNKGGVIDETVVPDPVTQYGRYKLMSEQIAQDCGLKTVILRPFNASGGLAKFIPNVKSGNVTVMGDGSAVRDFVHVEDLADAFVKALGSSPDVYNIGSGYGYSLNEIISMRGNVNVTYGAERENDPKVLVADITKARSKLGWEPHKTIMDILK